MKRLIVFVFVVALLGGCDTGVVNDVENKAENKVNTIVGYTFIPDENFEQALINLGYDDVIDGKVLTENISSIHSLNIQYIKISDLSGIEAFAALTELDCSQNKLTNLDLSKNTALTRLYCSRNQLTNLDLSKNTALTWLYCRDNKLTSLDVSQNTALTYLECGKNQFNSLDVSKNTALTYLGCRYSYLTSLDVSNNTALTILDLQSNFRLKSLDVGKNTALKRLNCFGAQFNCKALKAKYNLE
jgi:trimeric autotransporter adhesin